MQSKTPAKRLHALAEKHGLTIEEFSPGLRVWTIQKQGDRYNPNPLAFGVPHSSLAAKILELGNQQGEA